MATAPDKISTQAILLSVLFCAGLLSCSPSYSNVAQKADDELRQKLVQTISEADSFVDRFDAEVWLVQKSAVLAKYVKDPEYRLNILKEVHRAAKRAELPPEFVLAVIQIESHFNRYAVSRVGAQGIMQVMPFWKHEIGRDEDNLIDLQTNLKYGCTILKHYLDKEEGHWADALARYNGSYGRYTYSRKVIHAWSKNWR
ncbi:lytic transglycosylase domain-containing protein [Teredinibacter franksiae]|uniref:lytic transglycosylase domain-containing protein n=1 Tax=Teredinibacter franksiae TaxID=2761453 RepID=UPI00162A904E|nr:lytic transglycosylase domain-containing protein [Teredinibacter franksiae]